jgi:hypothetical protein
VQWLKAVILDVQEAKTGRIGIRGQPKQKSHKIPSQLMAGHDGEHLSSQQRDEH